MPTTIAIPQNCTELYECLCVGGTTPCDINGGGTTTLPNTLHMTITEMHIVDVPTLYAPSFYIGLSAKMRIEVIDLAWNEIFWSLDKWRDEVQPNIVSENCLDFTDENSDSNCTALEFGECFFNQLETTKRRSRPFGVEEIAFLDAAQIAVQPVLFAGNFVGSVIRPSLRIQGVGRLPFPGDDDPTPGGPRFCTTETNWGGIAGPTQLDFPGIDPCIVATNVRGIYQIDFTASSWCKVRIT